MDLFKVLSDKQAMSRLRIYFTWPQEFRALLPNLESVVRDLDLGQEAPVRSRGQGASVRRRGKPRKRRFVAPRQRMDDQTIQSLYHDFYTLDLFSSGGRFTMKDCAMLAKKYNCTNAAMRNRFYNWKRR